MGKFAGPGIALVVLCVTVGAFVGLSGFTFVYAHGASYLSNDPAACNNCHVMRDHFDAWQKSSHHAFATCNDCHVPKDVVGKYWTKLDHGYRHSKGFTFQDFHEPIRIKDSSLSVVEHNCVRCHTVAASEITMHAIGPGEESNCIHCHSGIGHGASR